MDKNLEVIEIINIDIRDNLIKHIGEIVEIGSFRLEHDVVSPYGRVKKKLDVTFGRLLGITAEDKAMVENLNGDYVCGVLIDLIAGFKVYRECNNETQNSKGDEMGLTERKMDDMTSDCAKSVHPQDGMPIRDQILETAKTIINGERQGTYGHAENSFSTIAQLWSAFLGKDLTAADVANMMILMKVARNTSGVYKEDNWVDICGYAALGGEIQRRDY